MSGKAKYKFNIGSKMTFLKKTLMSYCEKILGMKNLNSNKVSVPKNTFDLGKTI